MISPSSLKKSDGSLIWAVGNQHGGVRTYNVLPNTYDVTLVQGEKSLDVNDIVCTGETCNAGDVIADLAVEPERNLEEQHHYRIA